MVSAAKQADSSLSEVASETPNAHSCGQEANVIPLGGTAVIYGHAKNIDVSLAFKCSPEAKASQADICKSPARQVCNSNVNPGYTAMGRTYSSALEFEANMKQQASDACLSDPGCDVTKPMALFKKKQELLPEFEKQLFTPDRVKNAKTLFDNARAELVDYLQKKFGSNASAMISKIPSKLTFGKPHSKILEFSAHYDRVDKTINMGTMIFMMDQADSWEAMKMTLLHEMTHSFDLCSMRDQLPDQMMDIGECLQRQDSAGAVLANSEDNLDAFGHLHPLCPDHVSKPPILPRPQSSEAFSDLIAAGAYAGSLSGLDAKEKKERVMQSVGVLCFAYNAMKRCKREGEDRTLERIVSTNGQDDHPLPEDRINQIVFANPSLFKALGCKSEGAIYSAKSSEKSYSPNKRVNCEP